MAGESGEPKSDSAPRQAEMDANLQLSVGGDSSGGMSQNAHKRQHEIIQSLSFPVRLLGLSMGFLTMVFVCETTTHIVVFYCPEPWEQLSAYLLLALLSGILLMLSHYATRLIEYAPMFATSMYAYSTLLLVVNLWNAIDATIKVCSPEHHIFAVWLGGAILFIVLNAVYTTITSHNALLDIASCATSLGLNDDREDEFEPILAKALSRGVSFYTEKSPKGTPPHAKGP
mmetsp:Transcript_35120/g.99977  ORF Transcript_35120/g.99977 Transcript_35120/m.99977 type:complete len:229 (+) Transcript_35120:3-689(+)